MMLLENQGEFGCGCIPCIADGFWPVCANSYCCFIQSYQTANKWLATYSRSVERYGQLHSSCQCQYTFS